MKKFFLTEVVLIQEKGLKRKDGPLTQLSFAQSPNDLFKQGYMMLESFMDPMQAPGRVLHALHQLDSFYSTTLKALKEFVSSRVP